MLSKKKCPSQTPNLFSRAETHIYWRQTHSSLTTESRQHGAHSIDEPTWVGEVSREWTTQKLSVWRQCFFLASNSILLSVPAPASCWSMWVRPVRKIWPPYCCKGLKDEPDQHQRRLAHSMCIFPLELKGSMLSFQIKKLTFWFFPSERGEIPNIPVLAL